MLIEPFFGWPQLVALILLVQRGLEELHSARNTARLLDEGASEAGAGYYPVVAVTHLGWIAGLALLIPPTAPVSVTLAVLYLALQVARYWIIGTLGRFWTHRIITLPGAPIVTGGPYRFVRHPNYVVTGVETLLLPLVFGAWAFGVIYAAVWGAVLVYKIRLEDDALAARRGGGGGEA